MTMLLLSLYMCVFISLMRNRNHMRNLLRNREIACVTIYIRFFISYVLKNILPYTWKYKKAQCLHVDTKNIKSLRNIPTLNFFSRNRILRLVFTSQTHLSGYVQKRNQNRKEPKMTKYPLIFDVEIIKCIPNKNETHNLSNLDYCEGWHDFENMGISVICAYDYKEATYKTFLQDNLNEFKELANERALVGFNSVAFDDKLIQANGINATTTYDLLEEVRLASGQPKQYGKGTRRGYSLDALAKANLNTSKTSSGSLAPEMWQQGKFGAVIDYCLQDVVITKKLFDLSQKFHIVDPTNNSILNLRSFL